MMTTLPPIDRVSVPAEWVSFTVADDADTLDRDVIVTEPHVATLNLLELHATLYGGPEGALEP